jgi:hypothetical protein
MIGKRSLCGFQFRRAAHRITRAELKEHATGIITLAPVHRPTRNLVLNRLQRDFHRLVLVYNGYRRRRISRQGASTAERPFPALSDCTVSNFAAPGTLFF